MAKELLKEAIADAKAVREVALQNAKMALEEAFDSKIKNMLSAKLAEEIEEDDLDEAYMEDEKEEKSEAMSYDEDDKVDEVKDDDDLDEAYHEDDDGVDEEINLDELMAELDEVSDEEDMDENLHEDEEGSDADLDKLEKALGENSESSESLDESIIAGLAGVPALIAATGGLTYLEDKLETDKEFASKYPKIVKLLDFMKKTGSAMASGKKEGVEKDDETVTKTSTLILWLLKLKLTCMKTKMKTQLMKVLLATTKKSEEKVELDLMIKLAEKVEQDMMVQLKSSKKSVTQL